MLNEHATLFMSVLGNLQSPTKLLRLSSNGVLRRARHLHLSTPPSISSCQWCLLFVTGSWYRGLTVLGGGGVRKDSFPPSPSPSNASCHAGYFLSAKRHKGSLWQCLNSSFPDCSLKASSTTGNRESRACSQTSGNQGFFTDLLMPGTFFYSSRCDMKFILVS